MTERGVFRLFAKPSRLTIFTDHRFVSVTHFLLALVAGSTITQGNGAGNGDRRMAGITAKRCRVSFASKPIGRIGFDVKAKTGPEFRNKVDHLQSV